MVVRDGQDVERAISTTLSEEGDDPDVLRPLLDAVRRVGEARQLAPLVETVERVRPASDMQLAQIFTATLERMTLAAGKMGGEFHTPESITELAAALLNPRPTDRVLDPCCKTGGFPAAIADRLTQQGEVVDRLTVEISDYWPRSCALAYLKLRLSGVTPRVLPSAAESLPAGEPRARYDVVTANPPFNLANWNRELTDGRWKYGAPPPYNSNFAWLQYIAASLGPGGRAAVVMPHGAGFSENTQERSIRGAMLSDDVISAVIALPGQMFASTDIPVTLWLLQYPTGERPGEVLFVDATGLGTVQDRNRRALTRADIDRIAETYREWREQAGTSVAGFAAGVSIDEIRNGGYRLNPRAYVGSTSEAPDLQGQAEQVSRLALRLRQLGEQADAVDRSIEAHLKELAL
jgi:type I restriction enzyme M protein